MNYDVAQARRDLVLRKGSQPLPVAALPAQVTSAALATLIRPLPDSCRVLSRLIVHHIAGVFLSGLCCAGSRRLVLEHQGSASHTAASFALLPPRPSPPNPTRAR